MSSKPQQDRTAQLPTSKDETPDIVPDRKLTPSEAEADYQKQLDLLRQQIAESGNMKKTA